MFRELKALLLTEEDWNSFGGIWAAGISLALAAGISLAFGCGYFFGLCFWIGWFQNKALGFAGAFIFVADFK